MALAGAVPEATGAAEATALEQQGQWPEALAAWENCSQDAREGRRCKARAERLRPQKADQFVGWAELEAVRQHYNDMGSDQALARIQKLLQDHPQTPARPEIDAWLANEYHRRGDTPALSALATQTPLAETLLGQQQKQDRSFYGQILGFGLTTLYCLWGLFGKGPVDKQAAGLAFGVVGLIPMGLAWAYDPSYLRPFAAISLGIGGLVLLAPRVPWPLGLMGSLGFFAGIACWQGWL